MYLLNNFLSILFLLIPLVLISGPFLPDLFLSILALYGLLSFFLFKDIRNKYFFEYEILIIFAFYIWIMISTLLSNNIIFSLESSLFYFRYPFFCFGVLCLLHTKPELINYFSKIVILSISVVFLDVVSEILMGQSIFGNISPFKHDGRFSSFFGDELVMGKYTTLIYLFGLIFLLDKNFLNSKFYRNCSIILYSSIAFIIIISSSERTALVLFFVSCLILSFSKIFSIKFKLTFLLIFTSIFICMISVNSNIRDRVVTSTFDQVFGIKNFGLSNIKIFSSIHELHYQTAYNMFRDNKISGIGPKMFRLECSNKNYKVDPSYQVKKDYGISSGCSTHPHNYYIQLLAETGIVGFLLILSLLLCIFLRSINYLKDSAQNSKNYLFIIPVIIIFLNLFPFVPSNSFFNNWISVFIFLPIPFYLYYLKNK